MAFENGDSGGQPIWFLNRTVVVVRPKRPYVAWVNEADDDGPTLSLAEARAEPDAFLIPDFETREESMAWLRDHCSTIFEIYLDGWETASSRWPSDRSWKVFRQWFDVEIIEIAWDLVEEPLSSEPPSELDE